MLIDLTFLANNYCTEDPQPLTRAPLQVYSFINGLDHEKAFVNHNADPYVYDSGNKLTVLYKRNEDDPNALENQILSFKNRRAKNTAILNTLRKLLPTISHLYPTMTRITLETVYGNLNPSVIEDVEEIIQYHPIPTHLSHISTVPITKLQKIADLSMDVDRVEWDGQTWAFKRTRANFEGTLREISVLDQLSDSPYIISLKAIVINQDNTIRGFLTPFMYHGDLTNVFDMGHSLRDDGDTIAFDWSLKLSWARQITHGVVDLHDISVCHGDLKPQNILLGPGAQAVLVDFCPVGITCDFAAPEILARFNDYEIAFESLLTAAADMYSLGLLLYAIAEEKSSIIWPLIWRDGKTPEWYRDSVQRCLLEEPGVRPSAVELLHILDKEES